ncbi:hypothetical protein KR059_003206 [Drosophila kikkawai]|nr:hypothetical protein KR059_003206 [Drosophila kikkawai]
MKFLLVLSCLVLYVALTCAQDHCRGRPRKWSFTLTFILIHTKINCIHNLKKKGHQDCDGGRNEGVRHAHGCDPEPNPVMWYYNRATRECLRMSYNGCHGNSNRYCSKAHCESSCNRRD